MLGISATVLARQGSSSSFEVLLPIDPEMPALEDEEEEQRSAQPIDAGDNYPDMPELRQQLPAPLHQHFVIWRRFSVGIEGAGG